MWVRGIIAQCLIASSLCAATNPDTVALLESLSSLRKKPSSCQKTQPLILFIELEKLLEDLPELREEFYSLSSLEKQQLKDLIDQLNLFLNQEFLESQSSS